MHIVYIFHGVSFHLGVFYHYVQNTSTLKAQPSFVKHRSHTSLAQISALICPVPFSSRYLRNSTYTAITIHDNATDM